MHLRAAASLARSKELGDRAAAGRSETLSPKSPPQKALGEQECFMLEKEENTSFASLKQ